jgi:hypothetical protein
VQEPRGYRVYQKNDGTFTTEEHERIMGAAGSRKKQHLAVKAGITNECKQLWATSIIVTFEGDKRLESDEWLRTETDAFYAVQQASGKHAE